MFNRLLQTSANFFEQVNGAAGIASLVVVPAHELEEFLVQLDAAAGVESYPRLHSKQTKSLIGDNFVIDANVINHHLCRERSVLPMNLPPTARFRISSYNGLSAVSTFKKC